ncbi:MAG TPA: 4-(cytidine 5'-diphospho)-2-C-methyl-D-erythritol kinase [Verrucomicrobiaceae bacterium]|jgi:4-diphosphocytidyl-2-C-methyl-D-erythritol kinase
MLLTAPAKINLHLRILGRRDDGFHELETRICPISLADKIRLETRTDGKVKLTCADPTVPADESNLALRALRAFEAATGIRRGWNIDLQKTIPSGAGLGGGSSDAAAVLRGLNESCDHSLPAEVLYGLAAGLGSDVPFFLHGKTCDARGRGEAVIPVAFPWQLPVVLVKPRFGISTPWAYERWQESRELPGVLYAPQLCPWGVMVNHLERPVFEKWTMLAALKTWLLDQAETRAALMSGSGSTLFAVAQDGASAEALAQRAQAWCGDTTWVHVAQTL